MKMVFYRGFGSKNAKKRQGIAETIPCLFLRLEALQALPYRSTTAKIQCSVQIRVIWYARRDSNPQPSEPESDALSIEPLAPVLIIIADVPKKVKSFSQKMPRQFATMRLSILLLHDIIHKKKQETNFEQIRLRGL